MPPLNLLRVSEMLQRLQNTFEEESQQAGPRWLLKTYDDLTPEEKSIPDDWLPHLHHCNRMGALESQEKKEAARQKIWILVFDGWDTDSPIPEPTSPGESKATDGIVKIGVLDEDAPSSRKRKADGSMAPVPARRSRGADVFIKAKAHWLRQDLCFPLCDSRGIAFASNISYRKLPGSTLGRLKGECSSRWDSIEVYRGRKANNELVAYWARHKLVFSLKNNWRGRGDPEAVGLPGSRTTATLEGQPTMEIDQIIDLGKLTYIKLCIDIWEAYHDAASFHMAMNKDYSGVFELFGAVSSFIAISQALVAGRHIVNVLRDIPKIGSELQSLDFEIQSLASAVKAAEKQQHISRGRQAESLDLRLAKERLEKTVEGLQNLHRRVTRTDEDGNVKARKTRYLFLQKDLADCRDKIRDARDTLHLVLMNMNLEETTRMALRVESLTIQSTGHIPRAHECSRSVAPMAGNLLLITPHTTEYQFPKPVLNSDQAFPERSRAEVQQLILRKGNIYPDDCDSKGLTLLEWAITAGTPDVLEFLVQFWDGEIAKSHINKKCAFNAQSQLTGRPHMTSQESQAQHKKKTCEAPLRR
ncbi:hypothetical protein CGCF413_v015348 [Colletotrichum fructicola]|nr:hypothetical protein CGCF413_v015348 [Colletotrichum fructicola]